jgi:hypothetical protein
MSVFNSEDSQTVRSLLMTFGAFVALTAVLIGLALAIT